MRSSWRRCTIGDLCDAGIAELQTGPFGTQLHASDYVSHGVPVVPTEAIHDRRIDHSVLPCVEDAKAAELRRHRLVAGDILFARRGAQATGRVAYVRPAESGFLCGTGAIRLRLRSDVDSDYVGHALNSPITYCWLRAHAIGATMPNLNETVIRAVPLDLPPLSEQTATAQFLSSFDDKIELNRRMNRTLESIARAIFKSWFVDFDPVRKKMDGKSGHELGLPGSLVDQFPASLCQTSKGLTPEGWERVRLGAVAEFAKGRSYKSADLRTSRTALVTLGSFARGGGYRVDGLKDYVGEYKPTQVVDPGDVVVAHTDVTQAAEVLGRAVRVGASSSHETLVASLDAVIVRPDSRRLTKEFLFLALDTERFREHAYGYSNGTTVLHLSARALPEYTILLPPLVLVEAFSGVVEKLFARSASSADESPVLERARDSLLPCLLRDLA